MNTDSFEIVVFYGDDEYTHNVDIDYQVSEDDALMICKGVLYENAWTQVPFIILKNGKEVYSEGMNDSDMEDTVPYAQGI